MKADKKITSLVITTDSTYVRREIVFSNTSVTIISRKRASNSVTISPILEVQLRKRLKATQSDYDNNPSSRLLFPQPHKFGNPASFKKTYADAGKFPLLKFQHMNLRSSKRISGTKSWKMILSFVDMSRQVGNLRHQVIATHSLCCKLFLLFLANLSKLTMCLFQRIN